MLTRNVEVKSPGELPPKPTIGESISDAFQKPFFEVAGAASIAVPQLSNPDFRKIMKDKIDVINRSLNDPREGWFQQTANAAGELAGVVVASTPIAFLATEAVGAIATSVGVSAAAVLPRSTLGLLKKPISKLMSGEYAKYLPNMSVSEFGKSFAKFFGAYKGIVLPEHILNNYNKDTDKLNWTDTIKEWSADNYGFILPGTAFMAGGMLYKIFKIRKTEKTAKDLADKLLKQHEEVKKQREAGQKTEDLKSNLETVLDEAKQKGEITDKEHKWFNDYLANPNDTQGLLDKGMEILKDKNTIDRGTGGVFFPVIDKKNLKLFSNAMINQVTSGIDLQQSQALTQYIINNFLDKAMDTLRSNPELMEGISGTIAILNKKLRQQAKILEKTDNLLNEHVYRTDKELFEKPENKYLLKNMSAEDQRLLKEYHELKVNPEKFQNPVIRRAQLEKHHPELEREYEMITGNSLSQENIYKHFSTNKLSLKNSPFEIPQVVKDRLALDKKMKKASLDEMLKLKVQKDLLNFESIPAEIQRLSRKIIDSIDKNYKRTPEFKRLQELSELRKEAEYALDRIELEAEYEKQKAFSNLLESYIEAANSNASKFANPEKVIEYFKKQLSDEFPMSKDYINAKEQFEKSSEKSKKSQSDLTDIEKQIVEKLENVTESGAKGLEKELEIENKRYDQLKANEDVVSEAILCVLEKMNA